MRPIFSVALAFALASPLQGAQRGYVPRVESPDEEEDPDFHKLPAGQDLHSLVRHVGGCISDAAATDNVPSVDLFMANLEKQLRKGNDLPRDKILRNADSAREALRQGYNDLAEAEALLPAVRDAYAEVNERLSPLLDSNRESVLRVKEVSDSARALVAAIVLERPASPGPPVTVAALSAVAPLESGMRALLARLKQAEANLARAKTKVGQAKQSSASVAAFAETAARLDQEALDHVSQRRTRGTPTDYHVSMNSREVIYNANNWLQSAVAKSETVVKLLEQEGTRRAVEWALEADINTQNAKDKEISLAERINFNHEVRLNDLIPYGWDVASDERRGWWANRARMAKESCAEDTGKMEEAFRKAVVSAEKADKALQSSVRAVARVGEHLGKAPRTSQNLAKRLTDVPMIKESNNVLGSAPSGQPSKPLKVPRTFNVSDQEIIQSFDNR